MPKWSNTSAPQASSSFFLFTGERLRGHDDLSTDEEAKSKFSLRRDSRGAAHSSPCRADRGLEVVDELELDFGRRVGARAAPDGADAAVDRGARVEVRHRVHAEREGDVGAVVGGGADQRPGALEGEQAVLHVLGRARVEERPAGGAARAPVLDRLGARLDAELVVEALGGIERSSSLVRTGMRARLLDRPLGMRFLRNRDCSARSTATRLRSR